MEPFGVEYLVGSFRWYSVTVISVPQYYSPKWPIFKCLFVMKNIVIDQREKCHKTLVFFPRYGKSLCKDPATWQFWWLPLVYYGGTCSKLDQHRVSSFPLVCLCQAHHWCPDFLQVVFEEIKKVNMTLNTDDCSI